MYGFRWERWAALTGVLFVALLVIGVAMSGDAGDTPGELESYYAESGNRAKEIAAFFVIAAAGLAFLSFLGTLREMLVRAEGGPGTLSALVFGPGLVFVACLLTGSAISRAPAALAEQENFTLDANTAELLDGAGYLTIVAGLMAASILVLSASTAALRTGVLPAWLGWAGLIVSVVMLFSIFFLPILAFLAWVLAVSLVLTVAAWRVRAGAPPAAPPPTTTAAG
jgi:hypothetical protein